MRRALGMALGASTLAALLMGGSFTYRSWLPSDRSLRGTFIGGQLQPETESLGQWLERRRVALHSREVVLKLPEQYRVVGLSELGVELSVADTMGRVLAQSQQGPLGARLRQAYSARQGRVDLPLSFSLDRARARALLESLAPEVWRPPVNARLDLERHRRVVEQPGIELDLEATLDALDPDRLASGALQQLLTRAVEPAVTVSQLAAVDVSRVLSSYETTFFDSTPARARNIRVGAEYLSGSILLPGQTLSFNETVGPRRVDRGFAWAPEIIDDELRPGVGGGTCQLASTLHAAAVYGGVRVVARRSHSRPIGYAKLGLDATVIDGEVDLKLRNDYAEPLIIHAFLPRDRVLRVELLGREPRGRVEYFYAVSEKHEYYRRVTTKSWLAPGRRVRKQKGIFGYEVTSWVRTHLPDGTVDTHQYFSSYRPTPEVYWVGPGHDLSRLPSLPDGATHVEVDGEQLAGAGLEENPYQHDI